ncbi:MAG: hypothetical protein AAGF33_13130 [Pseudomonadota bacterium]
MIDPKSELEDFWTLPKTGPRVTLFNSAWTWTAIIYLLIVIVAWNTAMQGGIQLLGGWKGPAILAALIYPAFRVGLLISRYLKQRSPDRTIDAVSVLTGRKGKEPPPGSIEARMAERRARVAKAKEEGRL